MKFGADLKNSIVPEWEHGYIDYDALKKAIKSFSPPAANEALELEFFDRLESELEKVNRFYLEKIREFDGALAAMEGRPRSDSRDALGARTTENERMVSLHAQIGQLQAFVWLNTQGFEKIMKKYDKFMGHRHTPGAKAPAFEARLRNEVFKSERLDTCLEKFKLTRSSLSNNTGHLEMKLISGSANKPLAEEIAARLGVPLSPPRSAASTTERSTSSSATPCAGATSTSCSRRARPSTTTSWSSCSSSAPRGARRPRRSRPSCRTTGTRARTARTGAACPSPRRTWRG